MGGVASLVASLKINKECWAAMVLVGLGARQSWFRSVIGSSFPSFG